MGTEDLTLTNVTGANVRTSAGTEPLQSHRQTGRHMLPGASTCPQLWDPSTTSITLWMLWQLRICLQCRIPGFNPWVGKIPWRRAWQPTPVFLPGESPWTEAPWATIHRGHKESHMTKWLSIAHQDDRWVKLSLVTLLPEILKKNEWIGLHFPWSLIGTKFSVKILANTSESCWKMD